MSQRPWDPQLTKFLVDAHLEALRGGRSRPVGRRAPRKN
jgi:hypothetical protein